MYKKITAHSDLIYIFGLAMIFVGGLWIRMQLPPVPFFDKDTWGYLQPALSEFSTGSISPTFRGFFYPAILWAILKIWPNFLAIIVIQHAAGLIAGVLLIITWRRMRVFLPSIPWVQPCYYIAGWVMLTVYLFSYASILYEHTIRPEAFFPLITILCILLATEVSRGILLQSSKTACYDVLACLLTFLAFATYFLKPAWGLAALVAMAPLFAGRLSFRRLLPVGVGLVMVVVLFVIPGGIYHRKGNGSPSFLATTMVCASGEVVYKVLKEDAQLPVSDPRKAMADRLLPQFEAAIRSSAESIPFGYSQLNPDALMYGGAMETLREIFSGDSQKVMATCRYYYSRAWLRHPLAMLRKIAGQIAYFYCPWKSVIYSQGQNFHVTSRLKQSLENRRCSDRESVRPWPPYLEYMRQLQIWLERAPSLVIPSFIVAFSTILNPLYAPMALLAVTAAFGVLFTGRFPDLRTPAIWCLYLYSYNFVMTFTIAVVHMVTVDRYHFSQTIFSILSQNFATIFLACFIYRARQEYLRKRQESSIPSTHLHLLSDSKFGISPKA